MKQKTIYNSETGAPEYPIKTNELRNICARLLELSGGVAACSDILDAKGYKQSVMKPHIKPCFPEKGRMCGPAYTIRGGSVPGLPSETPEVRPTVDVEYYDNIQPGTVLVYGTDLTAEGTILGDVISTFAAAKGAVGAVADGMIRDVERIRPIDFKCFSAGISPKSGEGRILWIEYDCIVQVGGVWIEPYDIIYGDSDGVVVIPKHLANEIYDEAKVICEKEANIKEEIINSPDSSILDVFTKHGRRA